MGRSSTWPSASPSILGKSSFKDLSFTINNAEFTYGDFLVKGIKNMTGVEAAGAQGNRECDDCKSFIPVDASVCMYCTRDVVPVVS